MRRRLFAVLTMLLCLLTACGGRQTDALQAPMDFRAQLLRAGGCRFTADARVETGDRLWTFAMACELHTDGSAEFEILAPETISGIRASLDGAGGRLLFDGAAVDFGALPEQTLSPIAAPQRIFTCWTEDYIASAGSDGVCYLSGYGADELTAFTVFDEAGLPLQAELSKQGNVFFTMTITDFTY